MDLLSQRYASPFLILDEFIHLEQFHDFVNEIFKTINEEKKEQVRWEFYLHKVYDKTYDEFLNEIPKNTDSHHMSDEEIKNVINDSKDLLDLF